MKLNNYNNLLELFSNQYKSKDKNEIFLQSLNDKNLKFSWQQTYECIQKLSNYIRKYISPKDRCLIISENRPEWLISDLAIMLSEGITVPVYTTYTERDYEYIINDCKPSLIIISDDLQFKKIKNLISKNDYIKTVLSFDNIKEIEIVNVRKIFREISYEEQNLNKINLNNNNIYITYTW